MVPSSGSDASALLLDALDLWLRQQTIESVLPKHQAKALLAEAEQMSRLTRNCASALSQRCPMKAL